LIDGAFNPFRHPINEGIGLFKYRAYLVQEQLMYTECLGVEGIMQSSQVGDKFELRANMDGRIASLLPS
jgi:hypothetical protein